MNQSEYIYREKRITHWDGVSDFQKNPKRISIFYNQLIAHYYRFLVPPGLRILELGCGHGDLLADLKPSVGVGLDFSANMICTAAEKHPELFFIQADAHEIPLKQCFDVIILSDLVNDLRDVQKLLEKLHPLCHKGTRVILNFYNNIWRIPLSAAKFLKLGAMTLEQNWFSPDDMRNLLHLSDFEVVKYCPLILFPLKVPFLSEMLNRYLVRLWPVHWFALTSFMVARPVRQAAKNNPASVSVIVPARNEAGNIEDIIRRTPVMGEKTEIIFVEGHSQDNTFEIIEKMILQYSEKNCRLFRQTGKGKGDAVRLGFERAQGDILMILDADMTVPPEDLPRFYHAIASGKGEFVNGVRLVYPLEQDSMRFLNMVGNKFFSLAFSWLLGQPIKDTLCGTKVMRKRDYEMIAGNRHYFGEFDPFGDFDLLFGAAKLNFRIVEIPIRYRSRTYGNTNIERWKHGWLLLKMVLFAAKRIKFI